MAGVASETGGVNENIAGGSWRRKHNHPHRSLQRSSKSVASVSLVMV